MAKSPGEGRAADLARFPSRLWNVPRRPRTSASSPDGREALDRRKGVPRISSSGFTSPIWAGGERNRIELYCAILAPRHFLPRVRGDEMAQKGAFLFPAVLAD